MQFNQKLKVFGAQRVTIPDERTGEIRDYSKIFVVNEADESRNQIGQIPSSLPIDSAIFGQLERAKLPQEVDVTFESVSAGKGKTELRVVAVKRAAGAQTAS